AILAGFVTLLDTSGFSYESALFLLGLWAVRLFPAVFGAVCVYRLAIEPQVLPGLDAWCVRAGSRPGRRCPPSSPNGWPRRPEPLGVPRDGRGRASGSRTTHRDRRGDRLPEFFPRVAERRSERPRDGNVL